MNLDELNLIANGALFRRADLHIHSFGASSDVTDGSMTPQAIVEAAVSEGLAVIAITDHNQIKNVEPALACAKGKPLLVIPAVEINTTQGHVLLYFPTFEALQRGFGKLDVSANGSYFQNSLESCLNVAAGFGGVGIAAHIETGAGFEQKIPGCTPVKGGFLNCPNLVALECAAVASRDWYTANDTTAERAQLAKRRREALKREDDLPKVMGSDAHTLRALGRNAAGDRRVTRLKMDSLTFDAFRIALLDGVVRCRLEEEVPPAFPYILGVDFEGGFLDGQTIRLNSNLTCIIGGRGTGKSTALEAIRAASGNAAREGLVDSEIWPNAITLWYRDESGAVQKLVRQRDSYVVNDTNVDGITRIPIEGYGQGETAETIQHCGKDPGVLIEFLDKFINLEQELQKEEEILDELRDVQVTIARLVSDVKSLPRYKELKADALAKIATLKKERVAEIIALEESLAREKVYCRDLESHAGSMAVRAMGEPGLLAYVDGIEESWVKIGSEELRQVRAACAGYRADIGTHTQQCTQALQKCATSVRGAVAAWRVKEAAQRSQIETKRKVLEAAGVRVDAVFMKKVSENAAEYDAKIKDLTRKQGTLAQARVARKKYLEARLAVRSGIFTRRVALATGLTRSLAAAGSSDFHVTLRFREGCHSRDCQNIIIEAMQWRTSRVPRAEMLVEQMSVPGVLRALSAGDKSAFGKVVDETGKELFSDADQRQLLSGLSQESVLGRIETCRFEDRPMITVRGTVLLPDGTTKASHKDFSKLSLGQQQSIILSMLLFSDSSDPLIIDQPEDNLDSLFIAQVLVANLRKIKERRQVIMVTHNANIAVLADAELILPLRATSDHGEIAERGSIDARGIRAHVCRILEGGESAFRKRAEIYDLNRKAE